MCSAGELCCFPKLLVLLILPSPARRPLQCRLVLFSTVLAEVQISAALPLPFSPSVPSGAQRKWDVCRQGAGGTWHWRVTGISLRKAAFTSPVETTPPFPEMPPKGAHQHEGRARRKEQKGSNCLHMEATAAFLSFLLPLGSTGGNQGLLGKHQVCMAPLLPGVSLFCTTSTSVSWHEKGDAHSSSKTCLLLQGTHHFGAQASRGLPSWASRIPPCCQSRGKTAPLSILQHCRGEDVMHVSCWVQQGAHRENSTWSGGLPREQPDLPHTMQCREGSRERAQSLAGHVSTA